MLDIIENILAFIGAIFLILCCIGFIIAIFNLIYWNVFRHDKKNDYCINRKTKCTKNRYNLSR